MKKKGAAASCSTKSSAELCKRQGAPEISWVWHGYDRGGQAVMMCRARVALA
jgi:hypothetical protein